MTKPLVLPSRNRHRSKVRRLHHFWPAACFETADGIVEFAPEDLPEEGQVGVEGLAMRGGQYYAPDETVFHDVRDGRRSRRKQRLG